MASSMNPDPRAQTCDMAALTAAVSLPLTVAPEPLAHLDIDAEFEKMDQNIRRYDEAMARIRERRGVYRLFRTSV